MRFYEQKRSLQFADGNHAQAESGQYAEFNVPTCEHPLKPPMFDSLYRRS